MASTFTANAIPAPETIVIDGHRTSCDGGGGALGHPKVWLEIDHDKGFVECGYCDRRFVERGGPADTGK
ncbi:zinc-finger domain-containing protein [Hyphobacterium sp. SN044]|uniref:zinc-finger domain-containing protein n=1 Tax=Hyphobacterium sp. SN044 TaxID=2912575 RepID=UPI001F4048AB|nr:zinc-finger domain-containing protein [Hyphobacterium sp. SN044]MCF8880266.1 zinc-finger domain-containing protein [Hyphobacterium sp. SN044]